MFVVEYRVRVNVSYSNLHDVTNSTVEIPEVGMQLPVAGNTALVCMTV